ncbi:hypothetical protein WR25_03816 [Diploscapter pachys]|uniref:Uncharacterized protein n=1 Tax=Diploscapter pachys TaxID=2018661 RepID=A0A2A2J1E5_9BILA|nr:hypothetical protein WR25_03816 [Diploscapter pachys]
MHVFETDFLFATTVLEILAIIWNLYFIHYMLNKGQTDNRCYFLQHLLLACLANCLTMVFLLVNVYNPDEKDASKPSPNTVWFCGVYAFGCQTFSFYTLAFSRIVSITFKRTQIDSIWNCGIAFFATFIQILFPFILAVAPFLDDPQMHFEMLAGGEIEWANKDFHFGFVVSSTAMRVMLAVIITILYVLIIIRRIKVLSRAVNRPRHIVSSIYGQGQGDILEPNTLPYYSSRGVNLSILLCVIGAFELIKQLILTNGFPSRSEFQIVYAIFMSFLLPTAIFIQYHVPRVWANIKFSGWCVSFLIKVEQTQECSVGDGQYFVTTSKTTITNIKERNSMAPRFSLDSNKVGSFDESGRPSCISLGVEQGAGSPITPSFIQINTAAFQYP